MTVKKTATAVTAGVFAAGLAAAIPEVKKHEGVWLTARVDTVGTGRPVTWCYGETEGPVKVGQRFTQKQCDDMLAKKLVRYANSAAACIFVPISAKIFAAFIDFNYNLGEYRFCHSGVTAKLNAGDLPGACDALRPYVNAQGHFLRGLYNRRVDEIALCHEGVADMKPAKSWWQK